VIAIALLVPAIAQADAPHITLEGAAQAIAEAVVKADPKGPVGETVTIASIAPGDATKPVDTGPLRKALAHHKLAVIDDRTQDRATVITVEAATGARARIAVDQGGGAVFLTARPSTTRPPGKCVAIPNGRHTVHVNSMAINQDGERGEGHTFWDFKTERTHDVDGDGIPDAFVPVAKPHACPEEVSFRVFVVRGGCGHEVGVVGPGSFPWDAPTVALDASGFRPLTMTAESTSYGKHGIPVMTTTVRRFAVKRGRYVRVDLKKTAGVCHHCATWHCTSP